MNEFRRVRLLPFNCLIIFILQKANHSLQVCLDEFFDTQGGPVPSKSAFTQARKKLSYTVFKRLNRLVVDLFYQHGKFKKWKGFRVLSVDGSNLQLPDHPSLAQKFSCHHFGPVASRTSARWMSTISYLYDVYNGMVIDAQMESFKTSQTALCRRHFSYIKQGDIVLFDRLYAGYENMFELLGRKVHFVMQMKDNWWLCVNSFVESELKQQVVSLDLPTHFHHLLKKYPEMSATFQIRLVKRINRKGEVKVYATSLIDHQKYSARSILNLYRQRWGIEEAYKLIKARLHVADFSGKTLWAVQQDFYAKTLLISLCNVLCNDIKPRPRQKKDRKTKDRVPIINRTYALYKLKIALSQLLDKPPIEVLIKQFIECIKNKIEYSRKGQYFKRHQRLINVRFNMNYKRQ